MFPASFDYHRAETVEDAVRLLGGNPDAKLMAGGHSLIPMMKLRLAQPSAVIDIGRITGLAEIEAEEDGVRIGALATHASLASSSVLAHRCPLISEAAAKIADPAVRNKGTIGGNIAHADPASDLPAALLAAQATVHLHGPDGAREVAADAFFTGLLETDMAESEMLIAVTVPGWPAATGGAYLKHEHPASGYAICGAAAVVTVTAGKVTAARLAFNGVTPVAMAARGVNQALRGIVATDNVAIDRAVEHHLVFDDEPLSDIHASGDYRVALATAYGRRALKAARDRALA